MPSATRETLLATMKTALIEGNKETLGVVRMLVTEVKNAEMNDPKEPRRERNEEETVALLATYHKNLAKTLAEFPEERREPLRREMAIVETFLPKQLTGAELAAQIDELIASTPERSFGVLMKLASPRFSGRADGRAVSEALKSALAKVTGASKGTGA